MITINDSTYEILKNLKSRENESDTDFAIRISEKFASATHWICQKTDESEGVQEGVVYPYFLDKESGEYGEYVIQVNKEQLSMIWMVSEGQLLKKV